VPEERTPAEVRAAGRSKEEALQVASGTSGKAVVFAGTTVVLALGGLFVVNNPVFISLALAAIVVVIIAMIISVTLLPASMKLLGDLNWYLPSWLQWIPRIKMAE